MPLHVPIGGSYLFSFEPLEMGRFQVLKIISVKKFKKHDFLGEKMKTVK